MKNILQKKLFAFVLAFAVLLGTTSTARAVSPHEEQRITALISALEQQTNIVFIRNGSEHTAAEAAAHLRLKFSNARSRIDTAEQFIDNVASASSISRKPYLVRSLGSAEETANSFLHKLLQQAAL